MQAPKESSITLDLYHTAKNRYEWKELTYKMLVGKMNAEPSRFTDTHLSKYRWEAMLAYYHVDILNFPLLKEQIYAGLISHTCSKTGLSSEEVEAIFASAEKRIDVTKETVVPPLLVSDTTDSQVKLVSCGRIKYEVSTQTWRLLNKDKNFLLTFLNYSFLNPESGLFWSIAQEVYSVLQETAVGIQALECFASPFNYNLNSFCSVFSSDRSLHYPPGVRCYGDFFSYIETLKKHSDPVRLVLNPPYTDRLIDLVAQKVVSYMQVHNNGEFIAMLPDWTPQTGIKALEELPGSVSHRFAPREFYLYDSIHQKAIKPVGMRMLLIVNLGGDTAASQAKLEEIKTLITTIAQRVQ